MSATTDRPIYFASALEQTGSFDARSRFFFFFFPAAKLNFSRLAVATVGGSIVAATLILSSRFTLQRQKFAAATDFGIVAATAPVIDSSSLLN